MGQQEPSSIPVYSLLSEQLTTDPGSVNQRDLVIGSMLNLAVPKGARLTVTSLTKGSMEPVVVLDDAAYARIDRNRLDEREPLPAHSKQDGREVRHLWVNSYGKAQIDIDVATGVRRLIVGALYQAPSPYGRPVLLAASGQGSVPVFNTSYRDAGLWLKVSGKVTDGWQLQQGKGSDFAILRIEQLDVPYDDPPSVGIFIHGGSSMKSGDMAVMSGGLFARKTYPFKVNVLPVPAC